MLSSVYRQEHGEKCYFMKVVRKLPTSPRYHLRPSLPQVSSKMRRIWPENIKFRRKKAVSAVQLPFCSVLGVNTFNSENLKKKLDIYFQKLRPHFFLHSKRHITPPHLKKNIHVNIILLMILFFLSMLVSHSHT